MLTMTRRSLYIAVASHYEADMDYIAVGESDMLKLILSL